MENENKPVDKHLVNDPDARRWAREFLEAANGKELNHDWMSTWFANAIMCGHDIRTESAEIAALKKALANMTYSNASHREMAETWRAAAVERAALKKDLELARSECPA